VLTTFLTPNALLCSWESVDKRVREFSFFMLILEAAMIGVFLAGPVHFYLFWDAMLIPISFSSASGATSGASTLRSSSCSTR
jgi:NADH-quinone oxidoreductase subunit M